MKLQRKSEQQHRQLTSQKTGENYSLSSVISEGLFANQLFFSHEIIHPKSRSSGAHFHSETEEIIYVLKGTLKAIEDDAVVEINEGDSILFEPNSNKRHFLRNDSEFDGHVLVVRRQTKSSDVVF